MGCLWLVWEGGVHTVVVKHYSMAFMAVSHTAFSHFVLFRSLGLEETGQNRHTVFSVAVIFVFKMIPGT